MSSQLWLSDQYLSVPASIGFIELFGLAVGNGIVLVSYINQLRNEGQQTEAANHLGLCPPIASGRDDDDDDFLGLLPWCWRRGSARKCSDLGDVVVGGLFVDGFDPAGASGLVPDTFAEQDVTKEHAPGGCKPDPVWNHAEGEAPFWSFPPMMCCGNCLPHAKGPARGAERAAGNLCIRSAEASAQ